MTSWIALTPDDLPAGKFNALVSKLRAVGLAPGQLDPALEHIADVVQQIRIEISACESNQLDQREDAIPLELKSLAVRMVLRQMQSRLNVMGAMALSEDEREEQRRDDRRLQRIARCELPVSTPDFPVVPPVQAAAMGPRITPRPHRFKYQDGV